MNKRYKKSLMSVMHCVLQGFAMVFPEEILPDDNVPDAEGFVITRIRFRGMGEGSIAMALPREFCTLLAANALGVDPLDEQAKENGYDSVKEMINIAAGYFVMAMYGKKAVFDLMPPEIGPATAEEMRDIFYGADTALLADGHMVIAAAYINDEN